MQKPDTRNVVAMVQAIQSVGSEKAIEILQWNKAPNVAYVEMFLALASWDMSKMMMGKAVWCQDPDTGVISETLTLDIEGE